MKKSMTRRELLGGLAGGVAMASLPVITASGNKKKPQAKGKPTMDFKDEDFYTDGKLDEEAAKEAYYKLMKNLGCPVTDGFKERLWAIDFALGEFTKVGMGGVFWINSEEGKYLGHEIVLLPGQMIPEHWHVKEGEVPPKMEAWLVRHGSTYHGGEGEATELPESFPDSQKPSLVAKNVVEAKPGDVVEMGGPEQKHWMLAGPNGAVVTEFGSYHLMSALRFSNDKVSLD